MAVDRSGKGTDPLKAYNALAKYFGMRARDAFLDPLAPSNAANEGKDSGSKANIFDLFMDKLFSQGHTFDTIAQLDELLKSPGEQQKKIDENLSVTTFGGNNFSGFYNKAGRDQGWGKAQNQNFNLKELYEGNLEPPADSDIAVIQVFPSSTGLDVSDTEIAGLFLNSLTTINMSRAIPYMDVRIITKASLDDRGDNLARINDFSLGKFLSVKSDGVNQDGTLDPMMAIFRDGNSSTTPGSSIVSGMEVFTTPQTLVNRVDDPSYRREVGGRVDVFRPFMGIESLEITDQFSGAGAISYKSAEMTIKLFDKGRLSEIAELVTPRRNGNLKFEITYGWSHPDGDHIGRASDADVSTRLGRLIDAMRVTEVYVVGNSNFNIEADGTVTINLTLFMDAATTIANRDIADLNVSKNGKVGSITISKLANELESIKDTLLKLSGAARTKVELPLFVQAMDVNNTLALDAETLKELRTFISRIQTGKSGSDLAKAGAQLYRIFNNGKRESDLTKLRKGRSQLATEICDTLRRTPDPFLRPSQQGVTAKDLAGARKSLAADGTPTTGRRGRPQKYASYGKILTMFLGKALLERGDNEVQFVFGACNHNAGALFDHNISQIPIQIDDFQSRLTNLLETKGEVSVEMLIRFLSDEFISFDGLGAYGLSEILQPNKRSKEGQAVMNKKKKKILEAAAEGNPGALMKRQQVEEEMLNRVYGIGKRVNPTFTKPSVSVRIVSKKATSGPRTSAMKTITRVYVQDSACGRTMTTAEAIMNLVREGSTVNQDYSADAGPEVRGAKHNEIFAKNFQDLADRGIVADISKETKDKAKKALQEAGLTDQNGVKRVMDKLDKTKKLAKLPSSLRVFFYEKSPYLLYGTEGSGIVEASLSSEANDTLTSIFLSTRKGKSDESSAPEKPINLPFRVHPTSLDMTLFGCPFVSLMQKYFVDMGTNTTVDNYYHVVGVSHSFEGGNFQTQVNLKPYDAYGTFENVLQKVDDVLIKSILAEEKRLQPKKKK